MQLSQNETVSIQVSRSEKVYPFHDVDIIENPACRICLMEMNAEDIFSPCQCKGSNSYFHQQCLVQWLKKSQQQKQFMTYFSTCEVCKGRIFLLTKTKFRCITKEQLKYELFQKHICCTMTAIIFLVFSLIILAVILSVVSLTPQSTQIILYGAGLTVTLGIILITLIVYICTFAFKSDIQIIGIDRKRIRVPYSVYKKRNNSCQLIPQDTNPREFNLVNQNNNIDHLVV